MQTSGQILHSIVHTGVAFLSPCIYHIRTNYKNIMLSMEIAEMWQENFCLCVPASGTLRTGSNLFTLSGKCVEISIYSMRRKIMAV